MNTPEKKKQFEKNQSSRCANDHPARWPCLVHRDHRCLHQLPTLSAITKAVWAAVTRRANHRIRRAAVSRPADPNRIHGPDRSRHRVMAPRCHWIAPVRLKLSSAALFWMPRSNPLILSFSWRSTHRRWRNPITHSTKTTRQHVRFTIERRRSIQTIRFRRYDHQGHR